VRALFCSSAADRQRIPKTNRASGRVKPRGEMFFQMTNWIFVDSNVQ
jgi:hypothetical protein